MKNKKLAKQILEMAKLDQKIRKTYMKNPSLVKRVKKIDQLNLEKMKSLVKRFGWPAISLVGGKASHLAWLLVQHADSDVRFQEYCLKLMKRAAKENDVSKANIAYLADRILVNKGNPQVYGTQFYQDNSGKWIPRPIVDTKSLDERRKIMGLNKFEAYKKELERRKAWLL